MAGSIEKRGKNSYRLIVSEGYDLHGKPLIHRKTVHGTKKEAEVELAKFVTEVQNGLVIDGKALRFSEFVEIWKRDYGSKELAPSTISKWFVNNDEAAYRELFEETGISKNDIQLDHFMNLNYFKYENNLQVYYGILKHDVNLVEEKNKLEWVELNEELLNNNKFGGNYNIPHIITQIKIFLKNGTR